jgi:glycosyltransferase involved in cell wall biosynthesis
VNRSITVSAVLNTWTGYGGLACEVIAGLAARGWDVAVKPIRMEEICNSYPSPLPLEIKERIRPRCDAEIELLISPLDRPNTPTPGKKTFVFSMWEASCISPKQAAILNRAEAVIVPGWWQAKAFKAGGVTKPIHTVPLGAAPDIFVETPMPMAGPCVFGAAGSMSASRARKKLEWIIQVFLAAFKGKDDVELRIKILPGETLALPNDRRVRLNAEIMPWLSVQRWLSGLTAFVNVAVEGFGLWMLQSMAAARPCLAIEFGGQSEFFDGAVGYPITHFTHWNSMGDRSLGAFALPDFQSAVEQMRRVYLDRQEAADFGKLAAERARQFTWENTINKLEEALTWTPKSEH